MAHRSPKTKVSFITPFGDNERILKEDIREVVKRYSNEDIHVSIIYIQAENYKPVSKRKKRRM